MTNYYDSFLKECAIQKSFLIGEYIENKYVISRELKDELIKINKKITSYKIENMSCVAEVEGKNLNFLIKFHLNEMEGKKISGLYLLEEYKILNKTEKLETFIANFSDFEDPNYLDKLKKVFNLYTKDEADGKDIKYKSQLLEKLIKDKIILSKSFTNAMGIYNRNYVLEVLKILQKSGVAGQEIQLLLKKRLKDVKLEKNSVLYWEKIKDILDELIYSQYAKLSEESKKWLDLINQNYILMYLDKKKNLKINTQSAGKKQDKKIIVPEDKKKKPAKKADAKKSAKPKKKDKQKPNTSSSNQTVASKESKNNQTNKVNKYGKEWSILFTVKKQLELEPVFKEKNGFKEKDEKWFHDDIKKNEKPTSLNQNLSNCEFDDAQGLEF